MFKYVVYFEKFSSNINAIREIYTSPLRWTNKQNYYDILKLQPNCSAKEIRNAFITLSKEFHPDRNSNDPRNHVRFVQLNEAYSVLSRPLKRNEYDQTLVSRKRPHPAQYNSPHRHNMYNIYDQYQFWKPEQHAKTEDVSEKKKLSKSWIVVLCFLFTSVGVGLQYLAIRKSLTFSRERLDELSEANGRVLSDVRKRANENGNEMQIEIIKQKIEDSVQQHNLRRKNES